MNKRIKELSNKAVLTASETYAKGPDAIWLKEYNEKFAELIVEEMYVFMCNATDNDKPWPSFNDVKKHFGVEE